MCRKAMVMIDMPENCQTCRCSYFRHGTGDLGCVLKTGIDCSLTSVPKSCPLTPLEMQQMDSILKAVSDPMDLYKIGLCG